MVTMKVYVDVEVFCFIVNGLNESFTYEYGEKKIVSLKKTRKFKYEIFVPIQIVGHLHYKRKVSIDLFEMQKMSSLQI